MPRILALFVLASLAATARGQQAPVTSFGADDGIGAVFEMSRGARGLWLGTADGLVRYDGARMVPEPLPVAAASGVLAVSASADGHVWAWAPPHLVHLPPDGPAVRVRASETLQAALSRREGHSLRLIALEGGSAVVSAASGGLWIGSADGWTPLTNAPIQDISASGNRLWVLTRQRLGEVDLSAPAPPRWLPGTIWAAQHVRPHPEGAWLATEAGLYLVRRDGRRTTVLPDSARCWFTTPAVDASGALALTVETSALALLVVDPDGTVRHRVGPGDGLRAMTTTAVAFDDAGGLFAGSVLGLDYLDLSGDVRRWPISAVHDVSGVDVSPADGALWTTTYGGGVFRHDGTRLRVLRPETLPARTAAYLTALPDGSAVWIEIDRETQRGTSWRSDGERVERLGDRPIPVLVRPNGSHLVVAPNDRRRLRTASGTPVLTAGAADGTRGPPRGGRLWFHVNGRLESLDGDRLASRDDGAPADVRLVLARFDGREVTSLATGTDGDVWVGTDQGLARLRTARGAWTTTDLADRYPDLGVRIADVDVRGDTLTLATLRGVRSYRVAGDRLEPIALPGLARAIPSRAVSHVARTMGALWVLPAGLPGWVRYASPPAGESPRVVLSEARVNGRPVRSVPPVRADTARLDLAFAPAALGAHGGAIDYRLDGGSWTRFDGEPTLRLQALSPGEHTVETRAQRPGWAPGPTSTLVLRVTPPYYRSPWFFALIASGAVALAGLGVRRRAQQAQARERALEATVAERTAALETSLTTVEAQAQRLHDLDRAKARFFATISHELRTPLTLLLGPLRDAASADDLAAHRAAMERNGGRLLRLIDNLLDISRLEAGAFQVDRRPTDLVPFVRWLVAAFASRAEAEGLSLTYDAPERPVVAAVDRERIERIVFNLLENAFRHTEAGGAVRVRLGADGGAAVLDVEDTGDGIPPEAVVRVFERFRQVEGRAHGSLGLGLSLVREWAEAHDGSVDVESRLGEGTRFRVRLPLSAAPPEPLAATPEPPPKAPDAPPPATAPPDAPLVLLVDDHDDVRAYLRSRIEPHYRIAEAADGLDGLEAACRLRPALIVSDVMMPGADGVELCRRLRAEPALAATPVLLLTARTDEAVLLDGLRVGADDVLAKPFYTDELLLRIENLIEVRQRLRGGPSAAPPTASDEPDWLASVRGAVERHLDNPDLTVDWLASEAAMSTRSLQRRLKEESGLSPLAYIRAVRLEHAHALLASGDMTVRQVAHAVGFRDPAYFGRLFRQGYGVPPSSVPDAASVEAG